MAIAKRHNAKMQGFTVSRRAFLASGTAMALLPMMNVRAQAQDMTPVDGGILRLAFSADPAGMDPALGPSGMSHVVIEQIYSTLMSLDPDAQPYPDLAESFEVSDDGMTIYLCPAQGRKVPQWRRPDGRRREIHIRSPACAGFGLCLRFPGRHDRKGDRRRSPYRAFRS